MIAAKDEMSIKGLNIGGILRCLPKDICDAVSALAVIDVCKAEELRLAAGRPLMLYRGGYCGFVTNCGRLSDDPHSGLTVTQRHLAEAFRLICDNSVYAMEDEIRQGFITLQGGHRAGICGSAVVKDGEVAYIKDISAINIRFARQAKGAADKVIGHIVVGGEVKNTLVVSPPGCGKTTLLRDIARKLSDGFDGFRGAKVGLLDERGELAAVYRGMPQNDVGVRTVVMDACPKAAGMVMLLRSMGPEVIITDEIGTPRDAQAIESLLYAGVKVIASAHGHGEEDIMKNSHISGLLQNGFERLIVLSRRCGVGTVEEIKAYGN